MQGKLLPAVEAEIVLPSFDTQGGKFRVYMLLNKRDFTSQYLFLQVQGVGGDDNLPVA